MRVNTFWPQRNHVLTWSKKYRYYKHVENTGKKCNKVDKNLWVPRPKLNAQSLVLENDFEMSTYIISN